MTKLSGLTHEEVLRELREAGLVAVDAADKDRVLRRAASLASVWLRHRLDERVRPPNGDTKRPSSCARVLSLAGVSALWRRYDKTGEDRSHWNKSGLSPCALCEDDVFITVV
jgi:hypothetical protein